MNAVKQEIPAGEFKAKCLKLMNIVQETGQPLIVTKRGKPIVKLVPIADESAGSAFGCMEGTGVILDDVVSSVDIEWDAEK